MLNALLCLDFDIIAHNIP